MDEKYAFDIDGLNIEIERIDRGNQKKRLLMYYAYYLKFLRSNIDIAGDPKKEKLLEKIAYSLSDDDIAEFIDRLKNDDGKQETIEAVQELLEAYSDDDIDSYVDENINGNIFTYAKNIDIEPIRDKLVAIGYEMQGRKWRVELDEEGKVVLCE